MQTAITAQPAAAVVNPEVRYNERTNQFLLMVRPTDKEPVTFEIENPETFFASVRGELDKLRENLFRE
jgi:hypothetical protein